MKTSFLKPTLNPAFKITQPLPLLPVGFIARHAWAAKPFSAEVRPTEAFRLEASVTGRFALPLRNQINAQGARLVA